MKKLMTLALVALIATASQAISVSGMTQYTLSDTSNAGNYCVTSTTDAQYTVGSIVYVTDASALATNTSNYYYQNTLMRFYGRSAAGGEGNTGYFNMSILGTGAIATQGDGTTVKATNNTVTYANGRTEEETIALVATLITNGYNTVVATVDVSGTEKSITFYINGTEIGTSTYSTTGEVGSNYTAKNTSFINTSGVAVTAEAYYTADATVTAADVTAALNEQIETVLVPEPTCLALLALGVAGLALRRRA